MSKLGTIYSEINNEFDIGDIMLVSKAFKILFFS